MKVSNRQSLKANRKREKDYSYQSCPRKTFSKLTIKKIRLAVEKMGVLQVRPDMDGNLRFIPGYGFVDERNYWLSGKPVGGA